MALKHQLQFKSNYAFCFKLNIQRLSLLSLAADICRRFETIVSVYFWFVLAYVIVQLIPSNSRFIFLFPDQKHVHL